MLPDVWGKHEQGRVKEYRIVDLKLVYFDLCHILTPANEAETADFVLYYTPFTMHFSIKNCSATLPSV